MEPVCDDSTRSKSLIPTRQRCPQVDFLALRSVKRYLNVVGFGGLSGHFPSFPHTLGPNCPIKSMGTLTSEAESVTPIGKWLPEITTVQLFTCSRPLVSEYSLFLGPLLALQSPRSYQPTQCRPQRILHIVWHVPSFVVIGSPPTTSAYLELQSRISPVGVASWTTT